MSPIGRIFIVLNLILAAAFLGWASNAVATNQQWKAKHDKLATDSATQVAALDAKINELSVAVNQRTEETASQRNRADNEKSRADSLQVDLNEELDRNAELNGRVEAIEGKLGTINETLAKVEADRDKAVDDRIAADRARDDALEAQQAAELAQREAEEKLTLSGREIADLERDGEAMSKEIERLETDLAMLMAVTGADPDDFTRMPLIEGKVLAYRDDLGGLLTLNVGSENGVVRGYTFDIYSGPDYKGRVRVQNVQANMCSALVVQPVEDRVIAVGDDATTRL